MEPPVACGYTSVSESLPLTKAGLAVSVCTDSHICTPQVRNLAWFSQMWLKLEGTLRMCVAPVVARASLGGFVRLLTAALLCNPADASEYQHTQKALRESTSPFGTLWHHWDGCTLDWVFAATLVECSI